MTASQPSPDAATDYSSFPEHAVPAEEVMLRAHHAERAAWWFDDGDRGRFNLSNSRGTCYTATTIDTAVREKVRDEIFDSRVITRAFANAFQVSEVAAPRPYRCAAVSSGPAARWLIVRELVTMEDYSVPQSWASTFDGVGFDGIFYASAYTTGEASAYALFGDAGAPPAGVDFRESFRLSGADACNAVGMKVEDPPAAGALHIIR